MQNERKEEDMKKLALVAVIIFGVSVVIGFVLLGSEETVVSHEKSVAATIFPIFDIVQNVAGDEVDVVLILPPGASPHTYEPTPATLVMIQRSEVAYAVGHGLDDWVDGLLSNAGTEKMVVDDNVPLHVREEEDESEEEEHGHGHEHGDIDPHYWLDMLNGMAIARTVAGDLSARFPDSAAVFDRNLDVYLTRLRETHTSLLETLKPVEGRGLVTIHDAWGYFAEAYGMHVVGTFEPSPGREPAPQYLATLIQAVQEAGSRTLFTEPQVSTGSLDAFLSDNNLAIAILDPLGGEPGRDSYVELMLHNASVVAQAL
ncbi:metal ABC transporter substrate-binding protein [Patescibacteria group bacterium]